MSASLFLAQAAVPSSTIVWVVMGVVLLVIVFVAASMGGMVLLVLRARAAGADLAITDIIGMKLRKVDARLVVENYVRSHKAGLRIQLNKIETQYLAGGNVPRVIDAMILARGANIDLPWNDAMAIDLVGRDILSLVQAAIQPRVLACPAPGSRHSSIEAVSSDGVRFAAKAKVTIKTDLSRVVGGATEEVVLERVAASVQLVIGSMDHQAVMKGQNEIGTRLTDPRLYAGTAFDVLSVEVQIRQVG